MSTEFGVETRDDSTSSLTKLVAGIVSDVRELLDQHFVLLRQTMYRDARDAVNALALLSAGVVSASIAVVVLLFAGAYGLHWAVPWIPLWAALFLVGGIVLAIAGGLIAKGLARLDALKRGHTETAEAVKETVQCLRNNLKSS